MTPVRYVIYGHAQRIFKQDNAWYIHIEGSHESLCLGLDEPNIEPYDLIRITLEKVDQEPVNAIP